MWVWLKLKLTPKEDFRVVFMHSTINPLSPRSDQSQFSPNNIHT